MSETPTYRYGMDVGGTVTWTSCSTPRLTRPIGDEWQFIGESDDGKRWYWQRVPRGVFESTGTERGLVKGGDAT